MILRAENISRRYFRQGKGSNFFYAVKDASLTLEGGTLTEIRGRSGSGKSTFLNMLSGLLEPSEGKVMLDEKDLYLLPDQARSRLRRDHIGVIPQGQTGLHSLTVLENVKLPGWMYDGAPCSDERAMELLESVGIAALANVYPNELSGGEMRRMAIARSLVMEPEILLADEPTGDLDDANTATVLGLLRRIADGGTAVLLVTHEQADAYADRIFRMDGGCLVREE